MKLPGCEILGTAARTLAPPTNFPHAPATVVVEVFRMAEQSDGCSGETLVARCARKKRLQRRMTEDHCWVNTKENSGMFSKS